MDWKPMGIDRTDSWWGSSDSFQHNINLFPDNFEKLMLVVDELEESFGVEMVLKGATCAFRPIEGKILWEAQQSGVYKTIEAKNRKRAIFEACVELVMFTNNLIATDKITIISKQKQNHLSIVR